MSEAFYYDLIGQGLLTTPFSGGIALMVFDVTTVGPSVSRWPATTFQDRLVHCGWVAPAVELVLPEMTPGFYLHEAVWIEFTQQEHTYPAPGPWATHVVWNLSVGTTMNLYLLSD